MKLENLKVAGLLMLSIDLQIFQFHKDPHKIGKFEGRRTADAVHWRTGF